MFAGVEVYVLWCGVGVAGEVVVLALVDLLQPLRPFELQDIGLHADRCGLRGDHRAAAPGVGWRRQLEGEREAVGVAGLRQQRLGLPRVIGIVVRKIDISRMQRREMAAARRAVAEHGDRKSTRLNSSPYCASRMPSSA